MNEQVMVFYDEKSKKASFTQRIPLGVNRWIDESTNQLFIKGSIAGHTGDQIYLGSEVKRPNQDRVVVRRFEEDVFDEESLESFKGKPFTLKHPRGGVNIKVNPNEIRGVILEDGKRSGKNVLIDMVVNDEKIIRLIQTNRYKHLSLGYHADLVELEDGSLKQTNIYINHVALVDRPRAKNAKLADSMYYDEDYLGFEDEYEDKKNAKEENKGMNWLQKLFSSKKITFDDGTSVNLEFNDEDNDKDEKETKSKENDKDKGKDEVKKDEKQKDKKDEKTDEKTSKEENEENRKDKGEFEDMDMKELSKLIADAVSVATKEMNANFEKQLEELKPNIFDELQVKLDGQNKFEDESGEIILDYAQDEKLKRAYYSKLTNPQLHDSWEEFNQFQTRANKLTIH